MSEDGRTLRSSHLSRTAAKAKKRELIQKQAKESADTIALSQGGFSESPQIMPGHSPSFISPQQEAMEMRYQYRKKRLSELKRRKEKLLCRGEAR